MLGFGFRASVEVTRQVSVQLRGTKLTTIAYHNASCRVQEFKLIIDGQQCTSRTVVFTAASNELRITHQDILVDKTHLLAFRKYTDDINCTAAGPLQCLLSPKWKQDAQDGNGWVHKNSNKELTCHSINFCAMFVPKGLKRDFVPKLG
jgi:hypothetical protein